MKIELLAKCYMEFKFHVILFFFKFFAYNSIFLKSSFSLKLDFWKIKFKTRAYGKIITKQWYFATCFG